MCVGEPSRDDAGSRRVKSKTGGKPQEKVYYPANRLTRWALAYILLTIDAYLHSLERQNQLSRLDKLWVSESSPESDNNQG